MENFQQEHAINMPANELGNRNDRIQLRNENSLLNIFWTILKVKILKAGVGGSFHEIKNSSITESKSLNTRVQLDICLVVGAY